MTIGSLFHIPANAIFRFAASMDLAGIELGTIGLIFLILVLIAAFSSASGPSGSCFSSLR